MNVGYCKNINNPINNEVCPICCKNIYISKYYNDYACEDVNCPLGYGAENMILKISKILDMMKE